MISAEKIGELIKNPQLVQSVSVKDIDELREKFAYCSSLHLLYLKGLAINNDVHFEDELRYAAAHVMDRERMYYLIHSGEESQIITEESSKSQIPNPKQENSITASSENKENIVEILKQVQNDTKKAEEKAVVDLKKEDKPVVIPISKVESTQKLTVKSDEKIIPSTEVKPAEKDSEPVEKSIENKSTEKTDKLIEATILPTIVDALFEKELNSISENQTEKINPTSTDETLKQVQRDIPKSEEKKVVKPVVIIQKTETKKSPEIESKPTVDLSKLSFVEWLKYKQNHPTQSIEESVKSDAKTLDKEEQVQKQFQQNTEIKSKSRVDDLLNKFIKEEPSISKPKSEFFSPTKTAKQSLEESPDLVTETLARIYVLQKNYAKAIQAYQQLILVYPEKKTFFVSQIEKIKDEQV